MTAGNDVADSTPAICRLGATPSGRAGSSSSAAALTICKTQFWSRRNTRMIKENECNISEVIASHFKDFKTGGFLLGGFLTCPIALPLGFFDARLPRERILEINILPISSTNPVSPCGSLYAEPTPRWCVEMGFSSYYDLEAISLKCDLIHGSLFRQNSSNYQDIKSQATSYPWTETTRLANRIDVHWQS
jgi:hypothetical protein